MAWSFTDLRYGWRYVVGISLAATTIYVASNTRWRVNQADDIELDLAVAERCLATQYGTNAAGEPLYYVSPPEYVRSWHSNSYVTTNVPGDAVTNWTAQLHTNIYTNVIGWRTDRAKAVARDATIKALIPYYVDANSVYDGTTNIIMHTFTGLLASLDLGDHTNFTAIPAIGTNIATYGPWAWRNYIIAWQERYKVLEALKVLPCSFFTANTETRAILGLSGRTHYYFDWNALVEKVQECWVSGANTNTALPYSNIRIGQGGGGYLSYYSSASGITEYGVTNINENTIWSIQLYGATIRFLANVFVPDDVGLDGNLDIYIAKGTIVEPWGGYGVSSNWNDNGAGISEPTGWQILESLPLIVSGVVTGALWGYSDMSNHVPVMCSQPTEANKSTPIYGGDYTMYGNSEGYNLQVKGQGLLRYNFNYCTNKYW